MKPFHRYLLISAVLHLLFFLPWLVFQKISLPLAGGGSGNVTIDLIGGNTERGTQGQTLSKKLSEPRSTTVLKKEGDGNSIGAGIGSGNGLEGSDPTLAAIRIKIERTKHYPELAQRSGMEGKVLIHFEIDEKGLPQNILLKKSSGSSLLDQESLETIQRAAPYPPYKDSLEVWIHFSKN